MDDEGGRSGARFAGGLLVAAGSVAAARASAALAVRRWKRNRLPFDPADFEMPGVTSHLTSADGGTVRARVAGEGPTVVLGHGIAGHLGHWAPIAHQLIEREHRVVVFDQRGHGESVPGSEGLTLSGLAQDLAVVIRELGDGDVVVGGHSMGGIGIQSMQRYSPEAFEAVRGLCLVATLPRARSNPLAKVLVSSRGFDLYRRTLRNETLARILMRGGFGKDPAIAAIDYLRQSWDLCSDASLLGLGLALKGFDLSSETRSLSQPTEVICGTRDQVTPLSMSEELTELMPNAKLRSVPDAGHMIIWERPDLITESLARLARQ